MPTIAERAPVLPKRRLPDVPAVQLSLADEVATFEWNTLPDEVATYLDVLATFEHVIGRRPTWRAETAERGL